MSDGSIELIPDFQIKPVPFLARVTIYSNETGATIQEHTAVEGHVIPRGMRFRTMSHIMLQHHNGQLQQHNFFFHFDAADISEAFARLPEETAKGIEAEKQRLQAEMRRASLGAGLGMGLPPLGKRR